MDRFFNTVHVDKAALAHNLMEVRRLTGPGVKIMAVVKADAYGHGMVEAGRHFEASGADALGVMDLHEAAVLQDNGIKIPIYILAGTAPGHYDEIISRGLIPFVYDYGLAAELDKAAEKLGKKAMVQLKIDTGMNRLGSPLESVGKFLEDVQSLSNIEVKGLATHFADADSEDVEYFQMQKSRFENVVSRAKEMGFKPMLNSAANSAAVLADSGVHFDLVRPGIMLYGSCPGDHLLDKADLKPVMSLTSSVVQVKTIKAGEPVSYSRTWTADKDTVLAIVPVGYAHGYSRSLSNKGFSLIKERRAPIRGRVCMNLTMFDVTDIPGVSPGDEVVLLGGAGGDAVTGEMHADLTGTISYEIFCNIGGVNHRKYI